MSGSTEVKRQRPQRRQLRKTASLILTKVQLSSENGAPTPFRKTNSVRVKSLLAIVNCDCYSTRTFDEDVGAESPLFHLEVGQPPVEAVDRLLREQHVREIVWGIGVNSVGKNCISFVWRY